jgi:hypothetical protein
MNEQRFPAGWDKERVKRLVAELDERTDEEWIAADEAGAADGGDHAAQLGDLTIVIIESPETLGGDRSRFSQLAT